VEDTGTGIEDTKIIFEVFEQESKTVFRKFGGSGLGLAICKELVDLYAGKIKVESDVGKGSIFTVILPFTIGKEIELTEDIPTTELEQSSLAGKKVLLADDNEINQFVIESILKDWKMIVTLVSNGEEAIHKIASEKFDIVLMDIKMPVINGLEATSYIRKELHSEIPIIALTANSLPVEINKTREAGMSDFASKPIDPTLLYSKMLRHLGIMPGDQGNESISSIHTTEQLYDLSTIKELAKGSDDFLNTTIELFLDKTPSIIVSIKEALSKQNLSEIKSQVHKLKSTANLFKMDQVLALIDKIENFEEQDGNDDDLISSITLLEKLINEAKISLNNY
jgi:CheY-like chemotaxis protein